MAAEQLSQTNGRTKRRNPRPVATESPNATTEHADQASAHRPGDGWGRSHRIPRLEARGQPIGRQRQVADRITSSPNLRRDDSEDRSARNRNPHAAMNRAAGLPVGADRCGTGEFRPPTAVRWS